MGRILGLECKLYRNTGSYASPTWNEIGNVRDATLGMSKGEADVTTRGNNGWRAILGTLKEGTFDFSMVWDTEDDDFTAFQEAFFGNTQVEVAIMDGDIETSGSQGLRATMEVLSFQRQENLEEAVIAEVSLKPGYADNAPEWLEIP